MKTFESLGCTVEESTPEFDLDALWQAAIRLRSWQQSASLLPHYNDPAHRALLKPEAIYEIETALRQSGGDVTAASVLRTDWTQTMRRFFEHYDYFVVPTAQVFPFAIEQHWPREIAGQPMQTYHEWMKSTLLVTMSGCPALAVPAGFNDAGLAIGLQIIGPNRQEFSCLQMAYAYESAANSLNQRLPALLGNA
jgi:amidase